ncbi:MAG: hypothetical protein IPM98_18540 [Lewinellaceae bacterium]|nr:hypothetical protein [Lewinellaceae bacterium]
MDTAVVRLFDPGTTVQWVRHFRGRLDDVSEVLLSLGFDGNRCRGHLTYIESQERFVLTGTLEGVVLILNESDAGGLITGHITGTLQGEQIEAEWTNAVHTLGGSLEAKEAKVKSLVPKPCGENKWVRRYVARWNNGRIDLTLARVNNNLLNGYLWIEADNKTYAIKGKIFPDDHYEIQALLPGGKTAAHLQGSLKNPQAHDCAWVGSGEKRTFKLAQRSKLPVGCLEYANYVSSYDMQYPRPECAECNSTLDRRAAEWVEQCKTTFAAQKKPHRPENRNALRASGWYEVTCWTETLFCGYLTFAESWKDKTSGMSFNFDLRTGKEISFDDLFNRGFNAKEWFAEYARKESPKMTKFAADPAFREWLAAEGFPMFTIRRDGLELSTVFHPVYGQHSIIVPYNLLKPNMRRDNPIADLVK